MNSKHIMNQRILDKFIFSTIDDIESLPEEYNYRNIRICYIDSWQLSIPEIKLLIYLYNYGLTQTSNIIGIDKEVIRIKESKLLRFLRHPGRAKICSNIIPPYNFKKIYTMPFNNIEDSFFFNLYNRIYGWPQFLFSKDDKYLIPTIFHDNFKKFINNNIEEIEENGYVEYSGSFNCEQLKILSNYYGLNSYNKYISSKMNKKNQINYSIKNINKPIHLNDEKEMDELVKFASEHFGYENTSKRALISLIQNECKMVQRGIYTYINDKIKKIDFKNNKYTINFDNYKYIDNYNVNIEYNYFFDKIKTIDQIKISRDEINELFSEILVESDDFEDLEEGFEI